MTNDRHRVPRVLVTGASIGGPAVAWGLSRAGFDVTLLERSVQQRETGQNIDIRGIGRDVLERMGVRDEVMAHRTGEKGTRFVDDDGHPFALFPGVDGEDGPTAGIEILRGRLSQILIELVPRAVDARYGDFITAVTQDATGVDVTYDGGGTERFDFVVVAEGLTSRTRRILFGDETTYRDFGISIAYGTIDRVSGDTDQWDWYSAPGGLVASIRPDNEGTTRANMSFRSEPTGFETMPVDTQLSILRERFRGAAWQTDRILDGFTERKDEFYASRMEQVVVSTWSKGRVALLGDAAWGSGPTGMGTTLSLVGAYVLAGELAKTLGCTSDSPADAFARYEAIMRGYADVSQGLRPGAARLLHPMSKVGRTALRASLRVAALAPMRTFAQNTMLSSRKNVPALPDYLFARNNCLSTGE